MNNQNTAQMELPDILKELNPVIHDGIYQFKIATVARSVGMSSDAMVKKANGRSVVLQGAKHLSARPLYDLLKKYNPTRFKDSVDGERFASTIDALLKLSVVQPHSIRPTEVNPTEPDSNNSPERLKKRVGKKGEKKVESGGFSLDKMLFGIMRTIAVFLLSAFFGFVAYLAVAFAEAYLQAQLFTKVIPESNFMIWLIVAGFGQLIYVIVVMGRIQTDNVVGKAKVIMKDEKIDSWLFIFIAYNAVMNICRLFYDVDFDKTGFISFDFVVRLAIALLFPAVQSILGHRLHKQIVAMELVKKRK